MEAGRSNPVVEGEDLLHPPRTGEALGLLLDQYAPGGDDQHVVLEHGAVLELHAVRLGVHVVDRDLPELDSLVQLVRSGPHDLVGVGQAEGDEQQPRLVDVGIVLVDNHDLEVVGGIEAPQPVGTQGASGAASEDDDSLGHLSILACRDAGG